MDAQRNDGLALLAVANGRVLQLDFQSGALQEIARVPKGLDPWTRYAICWPHHKLAGNTTEDIFVADLKSEEVRWFKGFKALNLAFSHDAEKLAFIENAWLPDKGQPVQVLDSQRAKRRRSLTRPAGALRPDGRPMIATWSTTRRTRT